MCQLSDQWQVQDKCPRLPLDTNKDPRCRTQPAAITLLPAEESIMYFHNYAPPLPRQPPLRNAVKNKPKWSSKLPCGRTATSQRQPGGQNGVLHDIEGSQNGALLGTRAQTVTESTLMMREILLEWLVSLARKPSFCNKAYRITNTVLDWWVYKAGVGQCGAHMTMTHSCHMLHYGTKDWLCLGYTKVRKFSTYSTMRGAEFTLQRGAV